eukprot:Pgem_evm1s3454
MPPHLGQGCNQGMEDVRVLAPLIIDLASIKTTTPSSLQKQMTEAFQEYEKARKPFVDFIKNTSKHKSKIHTIQGGLAIW